MWITEKGTVRVNNGSILVGIGEAPLGNCVAGAGGTIYFLPGATVIIPFPGRMYELKGGNITGRLPVRTPNGLLSPSGGAADRQKSAALVSKTAEPRAEVPGPATLQGALSVQDGTLRIEIGGSPENSPAMRVTGPVTLGGKLVLQFTNGFAPAEGQKFSLFDFQSTVTGQFAQIEITGLAPGFEYELTPDASGLYTFTALSDGVAI